MPTYEYHCPNCGRFEHFQRITEPALASCPDCSSPVRRVVTGGLGVIYRGSGYYTTDNRSAEYKQKAKEETGAPKEAAAGK
ncbi:MAG: zinc ribbon domain-containing protein [Bacillota bacterium]|nr:zinc ribbon domain-containing protein [Bacillota bacterium]